MIQIPIENAISQATTSTVAKLAIGLMSVTTRKLQKKSKFTINDEREHENEKVKLAYDFTS